MKNSFILGTLFRIYDKLVFYYKNSGFCGIMQRTGKVFGNYAASSSILGFFDREWRIAGGWKDSKTLKLFMLPLKLLKYASNKLSGGTNSVLDGSRALGGAVYVMSSLLAMNTRVYGLLLLAFAVTQGLLDFAAGHGVQLVDTSGMIRLAVFLLGAVLVLINRPLKLLIDNSMVGRIAYDFFSLKGGMNDDK